MMPSVENFQALNADEQETAALHKSLATKQAGQVAVDEDEADLVGVESLVDLDQVDVDANSKLASLRDEVLPKYIMDPF